MKITTPSSRCINAPTSRNRPSASFHGTTSSSASSTTVSVPSLTPTTSTTTRSRRHTATHQMIRIPTTSTQASSTTTTASSTPAKATLYRPATNVDPFPPPPRSTFRAKNQPNYHRCQPRTLPPNNPVSGTIPPNRTYILTLTLQRKNPTPHFSHTPFSPHDHENATYMNPARKYNLATKSDRG